MKAGDWTAGDWTAGDWAAGDWAAGDWAAGRDVTTGTDDRKSRPMHP